MNGTLPAELWGWITAWVGLAGLCIGSFLNVCAWRIPRGESVAWPGSHCPKCGHALGLWDNIPVASWVGLRGKCRYCREPISWRYPVGELLTAGVWLGVWWTHGWTWETAALLAVASGLLAGAMIDCEHYILPDRITLGGIAAGLALSWALPGLQGAAAGARWTGLGLSAASAALGAGILWLVGLAGKAAFKRDAMGLGDVKLLAAIGACLGWRAVLFTVLASSLTGTLLGVGLLALGKREWSGRIPYGPHLALGAYVWMLWGSVLAAWYWGLAAGPGGVP
ncbi:MAG: prepilin peptidase [Kiritimatiellae bacterium]|nr:prepilin peptidase [Kiritimatiellia bacterium]